MDRFQIAKTKKVWTVVDTFFKMTEEEYKVNAYPTTLEGRMEATEFMHSMNNKWARVQQQQMA